MTNFVLYIHVQIRFASTEKNYSHRLACILLYVCSYHCKLRICVLLVIVLYCMFLIIVLYFGYKLSLLCA